MRPRIDDRSIRVLLATLPQFEECYLDLVEIYDEDLTPQVVFTELAEMVGNLVDSGDEDELLDNCLAAVEAVANTPGVDVAEVVAYSFLDGLRPHALDLVLERMGPTTERILALLDADQLELADEPLTTEDIADMRELEERGFLEPGTTAAIAADAAAPAGAG